MNNNNIALKQVKEATKNLEECCSIAVPIGDDNIVVTYDFETGNLIIGNWLDAVIDKKPFENRENTLLKALKEFKSIVKDELFLEAAQAMDRYTKSLEMGFPAYWISKRESEMMELLQRIDKAGLREIFNIYACVG